MVLEISAAASANFVLYNVESLSLGEENRRRSRNMMLLAVEVTSLPSAQSISQPVA